MEFVICRTSLKQRWTRKYVLRQKWRENSERRCLRKLRVSFRCFLSCFSFDNFNLLGASDALLELWNQRIQSTEPKINKQTSKKSSSLEEAKVLENSSHLHCEGNTNVTIKMLYFRSKRAAKKPKCKWKIKLCRCWLGRGVRVCVFTLVCHVIIGQISAIFQYFTCPLL